MLRSLAEDYIVYGQEIVERHAMVTKEFKYTRHQMKTIMFNLIKESFQ